jgi:hypothetical protein
MTSYLHPHVGSLIGQQRRRDMAARAERRRLAGQFGPAEARIGARISAMQV